MNDRHKKQYEIKLTWPRQMPFNLMAESSLFSIRTVFGVNLRKEKFCDFPLFVLRSCPSVRLFTNLPPCTPVTGRAKILSQKILSRGEVVLGQEELQGEIDFVANTIHYITSAQGRFFVFLYFQNRYFD